MNNKKNIFRTYSTFIIVFYCKINYVRMLKILHMKNLAKFRNFSSKLCYQNYFLASSKFFLFKVSCTYPRRMLTIMRKISEIS